MRIYMASKTDQFANRYIVLTGILYNKQYTTVLDALSYKEAYIFKNTRTAVNS